MGLPATGQIAMSQVNVELGYTAVYVRSLGDANVRALAGVASGSISFSHLRGKSAAPSLSVTATGQTNSGTSEGSSLVVHAVGRTTITGTYTSILWEILQQDGGTLGVLTNTTLDLSANVKMGAWAYVRARAKVSNGTTVAYSNEVELIIDYEANTGGVIQ